ncbi:MAG: 30S ribosomal protein S20 [Bacteroidota bacterium]
MPRHKSAVKRTRISARRAERNKSDISRIKTLIRKVRSAKDKKAGEAALKTAVKYLDKLAAKGVIHKNKAANQKSSLTKVVNKLA